MQMFTEWITQIVLYLLLAMLADTLLPSGLMKKYARLVLAILLLLIIIDPLLQLLKVNPHQIVQAVNEQMNANFETEQLTKEIEEKKNEIMRGQDAYTLQQVEEAVVSQLKSPLEAERAAIETVEFEFSSEPYSLDSLDKLTLTLSSNEEKSLVEDVVITASDESTHGMNHPNEENIKNLVAGNLGLNKQQIEIRWEEDHE
ncbi:stage III sporulation protein AF [Halobacillus massiliensis]|uniref:stage III sporulation protein AF n=1 Tax=Halobacillus massiliensis TaxID=1926286 RepID=UPI0009E19A2F|nr:stage III sporulation protein AF [Halobacillus massiliensis]